MAGELTVAEQERRHAVEIELDAAFQTGRMAYLTVGRCLAEILESRLYRDEYDTFDDYCTDLWNISSDKARRWATAYRVAQNLKKHESEMPLFCWDVINGFHPDHARVLAKLPEERQPDAWSAAKEVTRTPTVALLEEVASQFREELDAIDSKTKSEELEVYQRVSKATREAHLAARRWGWVNDGVKKFTSWFRGYDKPFEDDSLVAEALADIRRGVEKLKRLEAPMAK